MKAFLGHIGLVLGAFVLPHFLFGLARGAGWGPADTEGSESTLAALVMLATMAAFFVAGMRAPDAGRVRHLCALAAAFWLVNGLACIGMGLADGWPTGPGAAGEWAADTAGTLLGNLLFTLLCAGTGGVFSMAMADHLRKKKERTT